MEKKPPPPTNITQETDIDVNLPKAIAVDLTIPQEYVVHHYHHFANPLTLNIAQALTHVTLTLKEE